MVDSGAGRGGGGGRYLGKYLQGMCRWPLRAPIPLQSILRPIKDPILGTFGQICTFCDSPNLVTFYFYELTCFFKLNEEHFNFHLQYKHSGSLLTVNLKNCLTPKNPKMCDPILVTPVVKMQPHPLAHAHQPLIRKYSARGLIKVGRDCCGVDCLLPVYVL